MTVWLWDLTGAWSCSFQSFIIPTCQAWSWESVCSNMYIKRERKDGVLIINFFLCFFFLLFVSLTVVSCTAFVLRHARHLTEKISDKHFGKNHHKPPDCAAKETSDTDAYRAHLENTPTQSHPVTCSLFYLLSLRRPSLPLSAQRMCSAGVVTVCKPEPDLHYCRRGWRLACQYCNLALHTLGPVKSWFRHNLVRSSFSLRLYLIPL